MCVCGMHSGSHPVRVDVVVLVDGDAMRVVEEMASCLPSFERLSLDNKATWWVQGVKEGSGDGLLKDARNI